MCDQDYKSLITHSLLDEAIEAINDQLCVYAPNPQGSDYHCGFCGHEAADNTKPWDIAHRDCKGMSLVARLSKVLMGG